MSDIQETMDALQEAMVRFDDALDRVDKLADANKALAESNEKLARANRRQRWIIIGMAVLFVISIVLSVISIVNMVSLRGNAEADAERAVITALENCQTRNAANVNGRARDAAFLNAFEATLDKLVTGDSGHEFVTNLMAPLRAKAAVPSDEDVDCNKNGKLDPGDYP